MTLPCQPVAAQFTAARKLAQMAPQPQSERSRVKPGTARAYPPSITSRSGDVRALAWNRPYHAEHHAWPSVPFFRLPELPGLTHPHLKRVSRGYLGFFREYLAR